MRPASHNATVAVRGWMNDAACMDADPDLFFPAGFSDRYREQIDAATAICERCDVQDACLQTALAINERFGIWGGLTPPERRRLARRRSQHPPLSQQQVC